MNKNKSTNYTFDLKIVGETIKKLNDIVAPSMGAKGRMAIIDRGVGEKPLITDDGVTIAKEARNIFTNAERPVYNLCIEAMHNVEKTAFDGTTLTILLISEFYKYAEKLARKGYDAHVISEEIQHFAVVLIKYLEGVREKDISEEIVRQVATVSSKMPVIGDMIASAYNSAGSSMNVVIEHDRQRGDYQHTITRDEGFVLDMDGYYGDEFAALCTDAKMTKTEFDHARLVLLSSGSLEQNYGIGFFNSFPKGEAIPPLVFFISRSFDPKSLQWLINTLVNTNKSFQEQQIPTIKFQFVMLDSSTADRRFLDIAAYSNGTIQDATLGTKAYKFEHCGQAKKIIVEKFRTVIIKEDALENRVNVSKRVTDYEKFLEARKFTIGRVDEVDIKKSIAALTSGVVKLLIATPTRSEFELIRLKLDDAIGTVTKVCQSGYLRGCGRELLNAAGRVVFKKEQIAFCEAPMKQILVNAGHKFNAKDFSNGKGYAKADVIYDVKTKKMTTCKASGIYDSFEAYREAITNASSIVSQLVLGFVYLNK